jgi:hypothetical protein
VFSQDAPATAGSKNATEEERMAGYLFVTGLIFVLVGFFSLVDPVAALTPTLGVHLEGVNSFSQMRGTAGGVTAAIGAFLIYSASQPRLRYSALWTASVVLGGLEVGRLTSLVLDGVPGKLVLIYMAVEIFGLVQALFWLRREAAARLA